MEKSGTANTSSNYRAAPTGAGTSTSSGVTVYGPSMPLNQNSPPPPPSYEQATGTYTTTTTRHVTYNNNNPQWTTHGPNVVTQQYVAYATPASSSTTTYTYAPVPPPVTVANVHQPQSSMAQGPVVIVQQPMMPLGPEPVFITCPACHTQKLTRIEYEPSSRTHLMAALLCLFGLWCCVCLPYCAGSCMNTQHYCGNCNKYLGTYGNTL